ncbi:HNH endonuclease [Bradyrhizobium sp. SZCCHNRI2007]|uniref:HNH endonuclease n=1 Tax=Bradyrhizobium sp. SZCCHNRI2007 TaxID=3057281 RepID=UPI0028F04CF4|nr:HNH endonuclease [Bradyrhizobium sp. SZCCHNRI2007]
MIRETFTLARQQIELEAADLIDLSWTPWRRIMLSARDNIWCLVDADDYGWLSENVWNVSWGSRTPWQKYAKRNVGPDRATLRMHREIMVRHDPRSDRFMAKHPVDHDNGQTLDNRKANLAWVTHRQNCNNRRPRGAIPSLDEIVRDLVASLPQRQLSSEVPF